MGTLAHEPKPPDRAAPAAENAAENAAANGAGAAGGTAGPARLQRRTCAWCGVWITYAGTGRYARPLYSRAQCPGSRPSQRPRGIPTR
jgi:hypothetical protein